MSDLTLSQLNFTTPWSLDRDDSDITNENFVRILDKMIRCFDVFIDVNTNEL